MSDAWFYTVIGILIYWYLSECLCWGLKQYDVSENSKSNLKTFLMDFFFCPFMIIKALVTKKENITKYGIRCLFFYPISLFSFLFLESLVFLSDFVDDWNYRFNSRILRARNWIVLTSGRFFSDKK